MGAKSRIFVGDFETTVYAGQTRTDVWASACVEIYTENVQIFHSIEEQFEYFKSLKCNLTVYYHNLKFDGSFWLSYFINVLHLKQAIYKTGDGEYDIDFVDKKDMPNNSFTYSISDMGMWYRITAKVGGNYIDIRDSLKLLPFSVKRIGESFKTKHKKLDMKYEGFRYPGCVITDKEKEYIANDVLVVKEALEFMFTEGHKKLTIGSCCLSEFKRIIGKEDYEHFFPNLYEIPIDESIYGQPTAGDYIHKSYRGGWCYLARGKEGKVKGKGTTADVNSLYPSMMSSESGNYYPVGLPTFFKGKVPSTVKGNNDYYFFVRVRTRFYLKKDKLPFIQIKDNLLYKGTEMLETSDIYNYKTGKYSNNFIDLDGNTQTATLTMTMTQTDYKLFHSHYNVIDYEELDGCYFSTMIGIFDRYIEKYKKIKMESKGAMRELAKLFLNNLYGKMAASTDSSFKYVFSDEDECLHYKCVSKHDKTPGYIAVGSAITSYARCFTITAAQKNYHGRNNPGFIYADTDSIHCDLPEGEIEGITVHPTNFCCWKLEASWDTAIFTRQKTYIEHVVAEDCEPIEEPYYNIKCAGMPERCKVLFELSMTQPAKEIYDAKAKELDFTEDELMFAHEKRTLKDFTFGLKIPGKLMPQRVPGGTLLVPTTYEMR